MMVKKCIPSEDDQRWLSKYAFNIRKQAAKVNDWYSERVIRGHLRSHPPAKYVGEKVYVRMARKGGIKSAAKRRYVLEVKIFIAMCIKSPTSFLWLAKSGRSGCQLMT